MQYEKKKQLLEILEKNAGLSRRHRNPVQETRIYEWIAIYK